MDLKERAKRNIASGDDGLCVFCGIGIEDDEAMAAGPTSNYGYCCKSCFDRHVVDHRKPKVDIFEMEQDGQTACSCGSNDVKYNHRDEITVCQSCGTYW